MKEIFSVVEEGGDYSSSLAGEELPRVLGVYGNEVD
jgi:hypothetical protein